jgi:hypothetical protein
VDSAALMENAMRLPQGLDNCFAVTHTDHSITTTKTFFFSMGKRKMQKKVLDEELVMQIDREELGQLLSADPGFEVQNIEERGIATICLGRDR